MHIHAASRQSESLICLTCLRIPWRLALAFCLYSAIPTCNATSQQLFFHESCDDANFTTRGWYDNNRLTVTVAEHCPGSTASLEFRFLQGATTPTSGGGVRRLFPASDSVYLSYWVRYSANWEGSNRPYHPHEFHFITNVDDRYIGPAATHLTTYIEQNEGRPMMSIQDALNIDAARINQDLTSITEQRALAGCNGASDRYPIGDCYRAGADYRNGKSWKALCVCFSDTAGSFFKSDWHFVEAFFKLNSVAAGRGVADGIVRYWFDGQLMIDAPDVMLRTAENAAMRFNQFLIAPYIGDGSPVDQTMWVDEITVAEGRPIPSGIERMATPVAGGITGVHPHPLRGHATIGINLERAAHVVLTVEDALGRKVLEQVVGRRGKGRHPVVFNTAQLLPGVYHFMLRIDGTATTPRAFIVE
jgi:hypothetical protein